MSLWHPRFAGDMFKSEYDPDEDGVFAHPVIPYINTLSGVVLSAEDYKTGAGVVSPSIYILPDTKCELTTAAEDARRWTLDTFLYKRLLFTYQASLAAQTYSWDMPGFYDGKQSPSDGAYFSSLQNTFRTRRAGASTETTVSLDFTTEDTAEIDWESDVSCSLYKGGVLLVTHTTNVPNTAQPVVIYGFNTKAVATAWWCKARNIQVLPT